MRPLGALLSTNRPRTPVTDWPIERILALPSTAAVMAKLASVDLDSVGRTALERLLADVQERDLLVAGLPEGCWCFGRGGSGERAVLLSGPDVPMVLSVYCGCPIGAARKASDDELRAKVAAYAQEVQLAGIWDGARVPDRFAGCTFASFPATDQTQPIVAALRRWLREPAWAVVLWGQYGVGKTGLAISALREAAEHHHPGLFVKTPDLLARLRATYGKGSDTSEAEVVASLRTVNYLVLDDVGAEQATDWATSMLFQVLDDRHDHERKTILTTNLDIAELAAHMGERTMHRFEEGTVFLRLQGPNLRNGVAQP